MKRILLALFSLLLTFNVKSQSTLLNTNKPVVFLSDRASTGKVNDSIVIDIDANRKITIDQAKNRIFISPPAQFGNFKIIAKEDKTKPNSGNYFLIKFTCKDELGNDCYCIIANDWNVHFMRVTYDTFYTSYEIDIK